MKALVTGASGFVGSHLVEKLLAQGDSVRVLLRSPAAQKYLDLSKVEVAKGSLTDFESLKKAVQGVDVVYHVAGVVSAARVEDYYLANAEGTALLCKACADASIKRFVLVSSLAAAGPATSRTPRLESEENKPVSHYGKSKLAGEVEALKFKDKFPVSIVRPPMVYGPRDKGMFLFAQSVARGILPNFRGNNPEGEKYYSAVHVDDLCDVITKVGASSLPSGEVYYAAGDLVFSSTELLTIISEIIGKKPLKIPVPTAFVKVAGKAATLFARMTGKVGPLTEDKVHEILADYWVCSNEKAKRELAFLPRHDLRGGWQNTIEWYRKEGWIA